MSKRKSYNKAYNRGESKSLSNLISKLNLYYQAIEGCQDTDLEKYKKTISELRTFLQNCLSIENGYTTAFNHLIQNSQEYAMFKLKFTHAENFYERIIELDENENLLSLTDTDVSLKN